MKMGGKEQFKRVYFGKIPSFIIEGLQPKVRVCPMQKKSCSNIQIQESSEQSRNKQFIQNKDGEKLEEVISDEEAILGEWSEVQSTCTQDVQSIESLECAQVVHKDKEIIVTYDTPGTITSTYPYYYGKISWNITATVPSHSYGEDNTACLIIGVTNKQGKKYQIVGSTVNYGLHRETLKIKVQLDFTKNTMIIYTPTQPLGEIYNCLPHGLLYPVFQNKTSQKTTLSSLKLKVIFD